MKKFIFVAAVSCSILCLTLSGCDNSGNDNEIKVDIDKAVQAFEQNINDAEKNIKNTNK